MKKKILTTITLIMFCTLAFCQCVKAETEVKTTIQIKKGATAWKQISVSSAYDKCQELNNDNSALGTTSDNVMAHLSTNADWYAVSLLTYSIYGNKNYTNTTGNNSGIIEFRYSYTAGILEGAETLSNTTNFQSLIDNKDTKFVEVLQNYTNRASNKPGLGFRDDDLPEGQKYSYYGNSKSHPVTFREHGLFTVAFAFGRNSAETGFDTSAKFRPVIWVK